MRKPIKAIAKGVAIFRAWPVRKKTLVTLLTVFILWIAFALLQPIEVCYSNGYTCANTGSHKGHIEWFFGKKTHFTYSESSLERFMREHHPDKLAHRWVRTAGTGINIFGQSSSWRHGRTPMTGGLRAAYKLDEYLHEQPHDRLYEFFVIFSTGTDEQVATLISLIQEESLEAVLSR